MSFDFEIQPLITKAIAQLDNAYIPYSKYPVGCSLLTEDGTIIGGSNIENASYGLTICAERSALSWAASQGHRRFKCIVVATRDGGSCCGNCRQFIREFVHPDEKVPILFITPDGTIQQQTHIDELLPFSFGPENLNQKTSGLS